MAINYVGSGSNIVNNETLDPNAIRTIEIAARSSEIPIETLTAQIKEAAKAAETDNMTAANMVFSEANNTGSGTPQEYSDQEATFATIKAQLQTWDTFEKIRTAINLGGKTKLSSVQISMVIAGKMAESLAN